MTYSSVLRRGIATATVAGLLGCGGYIKQEQYESDLNQLREELRTEMAAGDQQVGDETSRRIGALESQIQSLQNDLSSLSSDFDARMAQMEGRLHIEMPVYFAFDDATIRESDTAVLDRFASVIREHHPNVLVTVEGFADPAGEESYNQWLGQQRAEAVRDYLIESGGLNGDNLKAVSYGEARNRQVDPGAWGDDGLNNRRVALVIEFVGS
ncbi:MAG: OmpA family protein [Gemmatimonadota bacterium]|nr:MAG: OmpA family protein [Gemmatimonadota bacterium]